MSGIGLLAGCGGLLRRADLLWARHFSSMAMVPMLAWVGLVRRAAALHSLLALVARLQVIGHSALLEHVGESAKSVPVAGVESIAPELPQFSISHLLCLLHLLWIQLEVRWIYGV